MLFPIECVIYTLFCNLSVINRAGGRMKTLFKIACCLCSIYSKIISMNVEMGIVSQQLHNQAPAYDGRQHGSPARARPVRFDLSSRQLTIERVLDVVRPYNAITVLNLSDNNIEEFDLAQLCTCLPCMNNLNVSSNRIQKLCTKMLAHMPTNFSLDLSDNPIKELEAGVEGVVRQLRDHDVAIHMYRTLLKHRLLARLEESLSRKSRIHLIEHTLAISIGGLLLAGGLLLLVLSENSSVKDSSSMSSFSSSIGQLRVNHSMVGFGLCSILAGFALTASEPILTLLQHDMHLSRLYWQ